MKKYSLKVNNLTFDVKFVDPVDMIENGFKEKLCGLTLYQENEVLINISLKDDLLMRTIIHELTHVYQWSYGLAGVKWNDESVCNFMETHAENILRDSQLIFKQYKKESK